MWSLVAGFYDSYLGTTVPTVDPTGTIAPDIELITRDWKCRSDARAWG